MNKNLTTVVKYGRELRCGYTTGSCATAVATAATQMLLTGERVDAVVITLPRGEQAVFEIVNSLCTPAKARCSVIKDAGDDPDVTDGIEIVAEVSFSERGITIFGGAGVGVVTAAGLQCQVGETAINPVPRRMIWQNVSAVCRRYGYEGGLKITIEAVNGEEIAKRTFNPRLGIVGGISILGTTGIVEPMSERAIVDTIKVLIDKARVQNSQTILISPGNYGRDYCIKHLGIDLDKGVKFGNFIGETLDYLVYRDFKEALLVGHIGKLVKLAGGIMNTHSAVADCRMEILGVYSAMAGASPAVVKQIMACLTTDAALAVLESHGLTETVFKMIMEKMRWHIDYRTQGKLQVEIIAFASNDKILAQTPQAGQLAAKLRGM